MSEKAQGAFLTISELAEALGLPQHILRYWETRFPQLRPLQRAGKRRYYRPDDVTLAKKIDRLLNQEGYTIKGVQKLLSERVPAPATPTASAPSGVPASPRADLLPELKRLRTHLADALAAA
ncbi:MerR family transcriptional regulator [Sphingobium boeckii]|uniref:DNA-binding transcriptional MerR regulator n=1 Tax=Sphingobium boeckii TaxID=1082345 RepID=A0A7W9EFR6_9SPHN|nr:MerR family transcriptional regulator [Sphingobium boeckii]MBB5687542.1 DNA-binding transcriptional MerR regulator [Sphingobium boeckii]